MAQVAAIENKSSKASADGVELKIASVSENKGGAGAKNGNAPAAEPESAQLAASAAALAAEQAKKDKQAKEERERQMALAPPPDQTKSSTLTCIQDFLEPLDIVTDIIYFASEMQDPTPLFSAIVWVFAVVNLIRIIIVKRSRHKIRKALLGGTPGAKSRDVMYAWRHAFFESIPMLLFIMMIEIPKSSECDLKCQEEGGEAYEASYLCLATLFVSIFNAFISPCYYIGRAQFTCIIDRDCTVMVTCFPCCALFICNFGAFRNDNPSMGNDINRLLGSNLV